MPVIECPICRKTITYVDVDDVPWRPFCSQRCKLIDLGRWLNEEYRISEEMPDVTRPGAGRPDPAEED
jgi:endogenous inhibitor of DNA gyrase (YacG/DUF329 family)